MYYYIYDSFLNSSKYEKILDKINQELVSLQISGEIGRVSSLRRLEDLVFEALKKNCHTLVAIGNDETVNKIINILFKEEFFQKEKFLLPVLGIIPVGQKNSLASLLGISEDSACQILSARITRFFDLGRINSSFFICQAEIKAEKEAFLRRMIFEIDENFKIKTDLNSAEMVNLGEISFPEKKMFSESQIYYRRFFSDPCDGQLNLIIKADQRLKSFRERFFFFKRKKLEKSLLQFKKLKIITPQSIPIFLDNRLLEKTPAFVEVRSKALKIIIGKQRKF